MDEELRRLEHLAKIDPEYQERYLNLQKRLGGFDFLFAKYLMLPPIPQHGWLPINAMQSTYPADEMRMDTHWLKKQWKHFLKSYLDPYSGLDRSLSPDPTGPYSDPDALSSWEMAYIRDSANHLMGFAAVNRHSEAWGLAEAFRLIYKMPLQVLYFGEAFITKLEPAKPVEGGYLLMSGEKIAYSEIGQFYPGSPERVFRKEFHIGVDPWELPFGTLLNPSDFSPIKLV